MKARRWTVGLIAATFCSLLLACGDSEDEPTTPVTAATSESALPTERCHETRKPDSEIVPYVSPEVWNLPVPAPNPAIDRMTGGVESASRCGLTIQVVGECGKPGSDGLRLKASGFTPSSLYQSTAYYPADSPQKGAVYENWKFGGYGKAAHDGTTPAWRWDCYEGQGPTIDPEGIYTLVIEDVMTGDRVRTTFEVRLP